MILILLNAAVIYVLFTVFSESAVNKKSNTTELAVLSVIGTSIVFIAIAVILGRIPALLGSMFWLFISFHFIGKLPLKKSLISAICLFLFNIMIALVVAKDSAPKTVKNDEKSSTPLMISTNTP